MTSELKPCRECKSDRVTCWNVSGGNQIICKDCKYVSGVHSNEDDARNEWNTRAVPDVPELEALKKYTVISPFAPIGEYILHSEAAEIIAADRAEKHRAQEAVLKLERELAQYKDQIPIGYITPKAQLSLLQEFSASDSISPVKMGECRVAIYDRPAPAADLKAENEKLREALTKISSPTQTAGLLWWQVEARAALNVEASNDKG